MRIKPPILYDANRKKLAILENAFKISYEKKYNNLWTGSFTLPADDPKNSLCQPLYLVELFDLERMDLFRILPKKVERSSSGKFKTYQLEHVLATLIDSVMFRYHEVGGIGTHTDQVLSYILSWQKTPHWQLGAVDISRQFQYSWENENLLAAMFSVPKPFDEEFEWVWDTVDYPWTISLRHPDDTIRAEVRYRANLQGLELLEDPTNLCTRIYALGQGEGINQLTVESVNPTGLPYIDADTQAQYGIVERIWVDRRFESSETLFESAKGMLNDLKKPRVTLSVDSANIHKATRLEIHRFRLGKMVRIIDEELGVNHVGRVISLAKSDVYGDPGNISMEISNRPQSLAGTVADLANRMRINEVYSQGATSIDSHQLVDNCDATNPMRIKFHIPTEAVFVNKILLNYDISAFRAYSTGAASGGGSSQTSSSGGGGTQTSSSGGGGTRTSSSGGGQTTSSGGGQTSSSSGSHSHTVTGASAGAHNHSNSGWTGYTSSSGFHRHSIPNPLTHTGGSHTHSISSGTSGSHTHSVSNHTHSVSNHTHSVSIPNHTHSVSIPSHTHSVTIPSHTHDIVYGIYSGPTPTAVTVRVDGNIVPDLELNETEVSILAYLDRDGGGKITRGWHEVSITPNALGRANVAIHIQQFIQSKGEVRI